MTLVNLEYSDTEYASYASVAEADERLNVDPVRSMRWFELLDAQKIQFLVAATYRLDLLNWQGEITDREMQSTKWPREGLFYADGTAIGANDIPIELQNATALLAGTIAMNPEVSQGGTTGTAIRAVEAGSARVSYFRSDARMRGFVIDEPTVLNLISQWLRSAATTAAVVSGTDDTSAFVDDQFDRVEGFA